MDEDAGFDLEALFLEEPTVETPPDGPPGESVPPAVSGDGPLCEECGDEIPWAGRGRKPKRCALHKNRTAGAKKAVSRAPTSARIREELVSDLTREIAFFGTGMSKVLPTTGLTTFKRAERTAQALVKVAGDNPRLLAALELGAKAVSYVDLGETGVAIGTALLVDLGRMNPDSAMANMVGVSETWHELNDEVPQSAEAAVDKAREERLTESVFSVPTPPRFERIT